MKLKFLITIVYLLMFLSLYGQNPDNHTNTFEIGLKIYSLRQNPIGINATNEYVDEFVSKYINGLYITFLKSKFNYRFSFDLYRYHNRYVASDLFDIEDGDEELDGQFSRYTLQGGLVKKILNTNFTPYVFCDLQLAFTNYTGDYYDISWTGNKTYYPFDIQSLGIGLSLGPGISLMVTRNLSFSFESSFSFLIYYFLKREDMVFFNEHEARINPINLVGISYKIK